jgi:hypothetical protein
MKPTFVRICLPPAALELREIEREQVPDPNVLRHTSSVTEVTRDSGFALRGR